MAKLTKKQLWKIYNDSPEAEHYKSGYRYFCICPHCKEKQTKENFISSRPGSFWAEWITLIQDYEITGVAKCAKCGGWSQVSG